ncbi:IS5 family transposase [Tropicimonas isoalkanivorans]|uniref:Transposase n=1 Tax=Tropicimonas isoalkanivorans TaxID=441112 RepID=A0A1I1JCV0_9RHOB|nr:IS5 family transposase [Tropicimonas isoalkanivorans]SFC45812.1 Transposase [Tropicimonas isoalkanivorans]
MGCVGRDAPSKYDPHKTLYTRRKRWSDKGFFALIMAGLAAEHGEEKTVLSDATYLKAHRTATSLAAKKGARPSDWLDQGRHEYQYARYLRQPLNLFVTAGQVSDYIGARARPGNLPDVDWLLGDRGYDADWFRGALKDKGIRACIPGRNQREATVKYDKRRYKRRKRIEIMFGRLKDWRRVATRYDRCPKVFLSAIVLAATVIFWL